MRARFPLSLKIIGWFLLNVTLLAAAAFVVIRSQFGIGLEAMINGRAGEKVGRAVGLISAELREAGPEGWEAELERFSGIYGLTFSLYRSNGEHVGGPDREIPERVVEEIRKHALPGPDRRGGPPAQPRPEPRAAGGPREPRPLFFIKTGSPKTYWLGARVRSGARERDRPPPRGQPRPGTVGGDGRPPGRGAPPDILLASTPSLGGNELLPDLRPWLFVGLGAIALSVVFWVPFVIGITRSLRSMRDATREIAAGRFTYRAPEGRNDEIGQLGAAINRMSGKLEGYVNGQRRFLGDVAHELCSPIARMQMALGVLEQRASPEQRPRVEGVREDLEQIAGLVNELLSFSKASLRPDAVQIGPVPLGPLINDIARRETGSLDAEIGIEETSGLEVLADKNLLGRALANLVRNAVRYAGAGGPIAVDARQTPDGRVEIRVADRGPGVPDEALDHIFEPFYRPDAARTPGSGGAGLGLAIVKTCIDACRGEVAARNTHPGFEVTISLQAAR